MASEIRVDKITSLSGVGTITPSPTGIEISGITTVATLKATTGIVTTLTATTGIVTTLTANTVTSLGAVSGTTGTFSGAVSGTTGTFTGDVDIADKIVHTGDTDTAIRFPSANTFSVETAGSQAFRVNSSGEFIMADTSTKTFIDLETTDNNTRALLSVKGKTSGGGDVTLKIGAFGDTQRGEIFTTTNHDLGFATNNDAAQFKMKTGGNLEIVNGDLKVASGHGIDFSATGEGSQGSMSNELLDDYEEGTWTPGVFFGNTDTGVSYSSRSGSYVKIGSVVYCQGQLDLSSKGSSTGNVTIGGLPYTAGDYITGTSQEGSGFFSWWGNFANTDAIPTTFWVSEGTTSATVYRAKDDNVSIQVQNNTHWANNTGVRIFLIYRST